MSPQRIRNIVLPLCAVLLAASCSTTRRLGSDEVLYTGVKKILIEPDSGVVLTPAAESAVKEPLSVAPNNPLYSPYLRTPLPVGLWAYNHLYTPKEKGFKYWFYKRLAKQPVLISKVQPQLRTKVAEQVLENYGYFGSRAADSLLYRKRGRKAKVRYTLGIAPAWRYSSIAYPQVGGGLKQLIDSLQATSLLRVGAQYNLDSLTLERKRISQLLRNRGYYYFRPEYMEYLADTTAGRRQVAPAPEPPAERSAGGPHALPRGRRHGPPDQHQTRPCGYAAPAGRDRHRPAAAENPPPGPVPAP